MIPSREDVAALPDAEARQLLGYIMVRFQKPKRMGKLIRQLIAIPVGGSGLLHASATSRSNLSMAKKRAREELNAPDADWRTHATNHGIRITRVR